MDKAISDKAHLVLTLPLDCLPPSALVDALHLAAGLKVVLRTRLIRGADWANVSAWCNAHELVGVRDEEGYAIIGLTDSVVREALTLDMSPNPHEIALGVLLGYPPCCCRAIAEVGEAAIDAYAEATRNRNFGGDYSLINPGEYVDGRTLICHLPCSPWCDDSLKLAKKALGFLRNDPRLLAMENWRQFRTVDAGINSR